MRNVTPHLWILLAWFFIPLKMGAQVRINEVMASNATVIADPYYGNYCDWIELYNPSDELADLSGFYLSDDPENLTMWSFQQGTMIPPNDYLLVYADGTGDGLHTNFKLSREGELVLLLDPSASVIDSISYSRLITDISFGRNLNDQFLLGYFKQPTPAEPNRNQIFSGISASPDFSLESGFYSGIQTLKIHPGSKASVIHYTLDGTEPGQESPVYYVPMNITGNTVIRVKVFEPGYISGPTITRSYFIDEPQNLPVVSLVTDPDHLFSDETGIYVQGTAGVPGYCTEVPHNVNQDWERPVNIELIEPDGTIGLNQMAGAQIFGGCSRVRYPIKSLAFFARKEYESTAFKYQLFPDKPADSYETFVLRAAADDQPFTYFRDGLTQMLVKDVIDVDMQAYRPVVLYINGEYWGIHNLREKINEHYPEDNYGVNSDSVDLLSKNPENSWNIMAGRADEYNAMIQYLRDHDITRDIHYEYIKTQMDVDEFINYQIVEIFFGARDWPGSNTKFWRSHEIPYNRWRWVLFDLDHMFKEYFSDIIEEATKLDCQCDWPNPPWSTYLFRRLLENESFRHEFTQRFALYSATWFSRERLHRYIDEMQAVLAPEIPRHIERWGGQKTNLPDNTWVSPIFNSMAEWEYNVQVMKDFTDTRHEMALKHLNDHFGTSGFNRLNLKSVPEGTGNIRIAGIENGEPGASIEFLAGESLDVSARAKDGYLFSHWELGDTDSQDTVLIERGDEWKYFISWNTPDPDWTSTGYGDQHWETGEAQLGYGEGDESTVVGYGGDPENKIITTWFRKRIFLSGASRFQKYTLNLLRDDGARVFLNGLEVIRSNMQRWEVHAYATAAEAVNGEDESRWISYGLNPALFRDGENVVAVEVHQASSTSSDLSFDLELIARSMEPGTTDTIRQRELTIDLTHDMELTAVFIPDENPVENIYINEVMASNDTGLTDEAGEYEDWIELYNGGDGTVDLAGIYLSDRYPGANPWMFPEWKPDLTAIGPGEYMIVFADDDQEQGTLHTNFKLSKEGEEVVLFQKKGSDTLVIDRLAFGPQMKNTPFGRFPDGSPVLEQLSYATPGASNVFQTGVSAPSASTGESLTVYPVPSGGVLYVRLDGQTATGDQTVEISVFSISGRKVHQSVHRLGNQSSTLIKLSLDHQPGGMYLVQVNTGNTIFVRRVILQ